MWGYYSTSPPGPLSIRWRGGIGVARSFFSHFLLPSPFTGEGRRGEGGEGESVWLDQLRFSLFFYFEQNFADRIQDIAQSTLYVSGSKTQHPKSTVVQELLAQVVVLLTTTMNTAVDFDNEVVRWSEEIDDKLLDDLLSAKFDAAELTVAYSLPEGFLGRSGVLAHISRQFYQLTLRQFILLLLDSPHFPFHISYSHFIFPFHIPIS